jgi:hypothetical protein
MSESCTCWKCGGPLPDLLFPLARHEECPHCRAQLHVCRMCVYFDTAAPQQCREPVAENVSDKQRANFCGYFRINPHVKAGPSDQAADTHRQLDALFGDESAEDASETATAEDASRKRLDELFKS